MIHLVYTRIRNYFNVRPIHLLNSVLENVGRLTLYCRL